MALEIFEKVFRMILENSFGKKKNVVLDDPREIILKTTTFVLWIIWMIHEKLFKNYFG